MKIFSKTSPGPTDKTVIMAVREALVQPFDAGAWLDLRIGFFLSICSGTDGSGDDTITGLSETVGPDPSTADNRVWIGVRNNGTVFPTGGGVVFMGYSNSEPGTERGHTNLASSDIGVGTTNSDYWRPNNALFPGSSSFKAMITDSVQQRSAFPEIVHMVQNFSGGHAAGYATLLGIRLTRGSPMLGSPITMEVYEGTNTTDIEFSSTPTNTELETNLKSFPTQVRTLGPVTTSAIPDSLFLYWPFTLSRLRIHSAGIVVVS
jgi:hypothetical protein